MTESDGVPVPTPVPDAVPVPVPDAEPVPVPAGQRTHGSGSIYGWLWRHLPGSRSAKVAILVVAAAAVVVLLFAVVFPWVEPRLPFNHVTVGGD